MSQEKKPVGLLARKLDSRRKRDAAGKLTNALNLRNPDTQSVGEVQLEPKPRPVMLPWK